MRSSQVELLVQLGVRLGGVASLSLKAVFSLVPPAKHQ